MKNPPKQLDAIGKAYWRQLANEFDIVPRNEKLIEMMAENYSLYRKCQNQIKEDGVMIESRTGVKKQHPSFATIWQAEMMIARLHKQLYGDTTQPVKVNTPRLDKFDEM